MHYVIKGFQENPEIQPGSPTGSKENLRLLLSVLSSSQWTPHSIDIRAVFYKVIILIKWCLLKFLLKLIAKITCGNKRNVSTDSVTLRYPGIFQ